MLTICLYVHIWASKTHSMRKSRVNFQSSRFHQLQSNKIKCRNNCLLYCYQCNIIAIKLGKRGFDVCVVFFILPLFISSYTFRRGTIANLFAGHFVKGKNIWVSLSVSLLFREHQPRISCRSTIRYKRATRDWWIVCIRNISRVNFSACGFWYNSRTLRFVYIFLSSADELSWIWALRSFDVLFFARAMARVGRVCRIWRCLYQKQYFL